MSGGMTRAGLLLVFGGTALVASARIGSVDMTARVMPWVEPGWRPRPRWTPQVRWARVVRRVRDHRLQFAVAVTVGVVGVAVTHDAVFAVAAAAVAVASLTKARSGVAARARRRTEQALSGELIVFAEYAALCLSSGMSVDAALARAAAHLQGHIAEALSEPHEARAGMTETAAMTDTAVAVPMVRMEQLRDLADDSGVAALRQLVDAMLTSSARGTPLADVMLAQAQQLRAHTHQRLLAESGRREVLMMVPIVFLIFPIVVVVALFPAWSQLRGIGW